MRFRANASSRRVGLSRRAPGGRRSRVRRQTGRSKRPWRWLPFPVRLAWARWRQRLSRHRVLRRVAIVGVSLLAVVSTAASRADANQARSLWGERVDVVVVNSDVEVGTLVGAVEFRIEPRPRALVAEDALLAMPDRDDRLVSPLRAGETLTERNLLSTRSTRIDLPPGTRAVAVPADGTFPPLEIGDLVDVVLVGEPFDRGGGNNRLLDQVAVVLLITEETLTLAVEPGDVAPIASALTTGRVAVALR